MRIPHYISRNTHAEYQPSPESLMLVGENQRNIVTENYEWDKNHTLSLAELCVAVIAQNWSKKQLLNELPCPNKEHLFELLPIDLELELVIPLIDYDFYWKRRYEETFGLVMMKNPPGWTWKKIYIERYVENLVEEAEPQYHDEEDMSEILKLCAPYVTRLVITQLQAWKPPLTWEKEDIPEIYPIDHINFAPVINKLPNIEELDIIYGMNKVGDLFNWNMFIFSVQDITRLGKAILTLKSLRIFRLHRCQLEDEHVQVLMQQLVKNTTIEELDISSCHIADHGAKCIAKLLMVHPNLKKLNIANNRITDSGAYSLGYALQEHALTLEEFNIKLNPIGYDGAVALMTGVLHGHRLKNLIICGCDFVEEAAIRMCNFLTVDTTLKKCDISNNWFDTVGGEGLVEALRVNKVIEWLDIRQTDITSEQEATINKLLLRNRKGPLGKEEGEMGSSDERASEEGGKDVEGDQKSKASEPPATSAKSDFEEEVIGELEY